MFKSKARKQAEFQLKVEREKERLQQQEEAREATRIRAAEDTRKVIKACIDGYRAAYQQHPKATIISTIVCSVFVLGIGGIRSNSFEHSSSPVALSTPAPVATQSQSLKKEASNLATPKQTITVKGFTPAFGEEGDFEVWYSVINHQVQLPGAIDNMKQEGRIYFILPGETVEVLETKECLQGVKCYQVNTQGANIMKGNGGSPFKPWVSNGLWIPADYVGPFAGDTDNESAAPQSQTQESETVSFTPEVTATTHWGTLHSNDGKINLRTGPGTVNKAIGYGINGERVQVLDSGQDSGGYYWYKVSFPNSGAVGWVAAQLINID